MSAFRSGLGSEVVATRACRMTENHVILTTWEHFRSKDVCHCPCFIVLRFKLTLIALSG